MSLFTDIAGAIKDVRKGLGLPPLTVRSLASVVRTTQQKGGVYVPEEVGRPFRIPMATAGTGFAPGGIPGLPSGSGNLPALPGARPKPGLGGWIERTLPGGKSGYEAAPGVPATAKPGLGGAVERILPGGSSGYYSVPQPVIEPQQTVRLTAPRGYVIVTMPDGSKQAMLKELARKFGLWKARPKPPVSGWDMKAINRAARSQRKVQNLAKKVGLTTRKKGTGTRSTGTRRKRC